MNYKDKNFLKFQDKQRSDDVSISDRREKREREKNILKFHLKYLSKESNKDWWDCISDSAKSDVINEFLYNRNFNFYNIKLKYKPNIQKLRDKKLNKLL